MFIEINFFSILFLFRNSLTIYFFCINKFLLFRKYIEFLIRKIKLINNLFKTFYY